MQVHGCTHLSYNRPFWGRCFTYWEGPWWWHL